MSDWVWFIAYKRGEAPHIVLSDRDVAGTVLDALGTIALNASARRLPERAGMLLHRTAERLLDAAERHTRTVVEIPAGEAVLAELAGHGLIGRDDEDVAS